MYLKIISFKIIFIFYLNMANSHRLHTIDEDWYNTEMIINTWFFRTKITFEGTGITPEVIPFKPTQTLYNPIEISGKYKAIYELGVLDDSIRDRVQRVRPPFVQNRPLRPVFFEVEYFKGEETISDLYYEEEYDINRTHYQFQYYYYEMKPRERLPHNWCKLFELGEPIFLIQFMADVPKRNVKSGLKHYAVTAKPFKTITFIEKWEVYIPKGTVMVFRCDDEKTKELKKYLLIGVIVLSVICLIMGIYSVLHEIYAHKHDAH